MTQNQQNVSLQPGTNSTLSTANQTPAERFTQKVVREFTGTGGAIALSDFQKRLVQNYFINLDQVLKTAEEKRLSKDAKYIKADELPFTWNNVNIEQLAINVVASARLGFDPALPNHINMIPFKNKKTNKFDIGFVAGYRGKELMAKKYGLDVPADVVIELVFSKDKFKPLKKDINNKVETYSFEIADNPFDRGDLVGGFYYLVFEDNTRNKLVFWSRHEIEKRRPATASVEFWGGNKDVWEKDENGKSYRKAGAGAYTEGWYLEMCWKTLCRAAYSSVTIDSQKIDDNYINLTANEQEFQASKSISTEDELQKNIAENSQTIPVQITESVVVETAPLNSETVIIETHHSQIYPEQPPLEEFPQGSDDVLFPKEAKEEKKTAAKTPKF
ncbi:MAG: recombinase RecT [Bacteroidota bacterium]